MPARMPPPCTHRPSDRVGRLAAETTVTVMGDPAPSCHRHRSPSGAGAARVRVTSSKCYGEPAHASRTAATPLTLCCGGRAGKKVWGRAPTATAAATTSGTARRMTRTTTRMTRTRRAATAAAMTVAARHVSAPHLGRPVTPHLHIPLRPAAPSPRHCHHRHHDAEAHHLHPPPAHRRKAAWAVLARCPRCGPQTMPPVWEEPLPAHPSCDSWRCHGFKSAHRHHCHAHHPAPSHGGCQVDPPQAPQPVLPHLQSRAAPQLLPLHQCCHLTPHRCRCRWYPTCKSSHPRCIHPASWCWCLHRYSPP